MGGGVVVDAVVGWSGVGWRRSVVWNPRRNEENEPRRSSWFVFMTHYAGPPHPGSPLAFLTPLFLPRASRKPPTSLWKGEGRVRVVLASEVSCGV